MTCIYKVTVKGPGKENLYRVTWFNTQTEEEDHFKTEAAEITPEDITSQWHLPAYRLETGRRLFRFLNGDAGHL